MAVAIVHEDEVVYLKGKGVRAKGRDEPITPDTIFPIASLTKAFTATALGILVDEGKVKWDDPVRTHVESFRLADPLADRDVTLRDLLCHRTGLPRQDLLWYRAPWPPEEIVRRAGALPLDRPFRTRFQYQSTMFTAAGLAVGSAAGRPWEEFVQKRLFVEGSTVKAGQPLYQIDPRPTRRFTTAHSRHWLRPRSNRSAMRGCWRKMRSRRRTRTTPGPPISRRRPTPMPHASISIIPA